MAHHAITYHEENKTTACFDMKAMRVLGKQSFSFLSFVIQQQRDAGPGDFPVLHRVFRHSCVIPVEKKLQKAIRIKSFSRDCRLRVRQMESIFPLYGIVSR